MIIFEFLFISIIVLLVLSWVYNFFTGEYVNPYPLIFVFAKKGQGKSTFLAKQAVLHLRKGWKVYSTEPIPGCTLIPVKDLCLCQLEPSSLLLIDEVGLIWHARDFKSMPKSTIEWFKLQRHRRVKVIMCSQTWDVDKAIRLLSDELWILRKQFRVWTYGKRILRQMDIIEAQGDSESRIVENLKYDSLLFFWAGSRSLTFIPAWTRYFDSFAAPPLPYKSLEELPVAEFELTRKPFKLRVLEAARWFRWRCGTYRRPKKRKNERDHF